MCNHRYYSLHWERISRACDDLKSVNNVKCKHIFYVWKICKNARLAQQLALFWVTGAFIFIIHTVCILSSYLYCYYNNLPLLSKRFVFYQTIFVDITMKPFTCMVQCIIFNVYVFGVLFWSSPSMDLSKCTNHECIIGVLKQISTLTKGGISYHQLETWQNTMHIQILKNSRLSNFSLFCGRNNTIHTCYCWNRW